MESTPSLGIDADSVTLDQLIAVAVGNSRTRVGLVKDKACHDASSFETDDPAGIGARVRELSRNQDEPPIVVISTVNPGAADEIERAIKDAGPLSVYRIGRDVPITIEHALTDSGAMTVGQDRLLCAIGAYEQLKQACVVVDLGTAVTIDFVDGAGTFHGGAILPGVSMMLGSLHEHTAALPKLVYKKIEPDSHDPGRQTDDAMMLGVTAAVRGAVRLLTERYAEYYNAYPRVIATGGDLGILEDEELVETLAPDLQLMGIHAACVRAIQDDESDDD
jgi:type III pantothenate kinase